MNHYTMEAFIFYVGEFGFCIEEDSEPFNGNGEGVFLELCLYCQWITELIELEAGKPLRILFLHSSL